MIKKVHAFPSFEIFTVTASPFFTGRKALQLFATEFQIRGHIEDNSTIIFLIFQ